MYPANSDLRYNLTWAQSIVATLSSRYPRATDIVLQIYSITPRQMALYLAKGDPVWPILRDRIHKLDACERRCDKRLTFEQAREWLGALHGVSADEKVKKRLLDRVRKSTTLKEQGTREGLEGGEANRETQPYSPSEATPFGRQFLLPFGGPFEDTPTRIVQGAQARCEESFAAREPS